MSSNYRKPLPASLLASSLAVAVAALIAAPGRAVAEQAQPSQSGGGQYQQPMDDPSGNATGGAAPAQQMPPSAAPSTSPSTQAAPDTGKPLYSKTPEELGNLDIVGANGQDLGKVSRVVRGRTDEAIYAVISWGGILGYGGHEVAVLLDELQLNGDKLQIGATEEDLKAKPEYQPDQYVELQPPDRPISEFSAFESGTPKQGGSTTAP
ncbi:MAG: PRC-barrel domain-containing protein [Gammaproteobacteria bacterium]|nr:PRC-barrel domain-containing protein [Gammaproteobacteria bacterium]